MKSHILSRAACVALSLTLLTPALASCNTTKDPANTDTEPTVPTVTTTPIEIHETEPTTESAVTTEAETEEAPSPYMELTTDVRIFCPTRRNRTLYKLSSSLATRIQEKTGIKLSVRYGGDDTAPAESEIILGYSTERPITTEAYKSIATNAYGVHTVGKTAILTAWTEADIEAAADLFIEAALKQEGDRWFILPQTTETATEADAFIPFSAYRIVYPAGADEMLVNTFIPLLQSLIKNQYGIELEAVSDASEPSEFEIVIGQTSRESEALRSYLETNGECPDYGFAVIPDKYSFYLAGGSTQALATALAKVLEVTIQPEIGPRVLAATSEIYESTPMITEDKAELAEGTELRIMSYNMLNQDYVPDNPLPPERDNRLAEILLYYMPDVVGVQEANIDWHNSFDTLIPAYAPACKYHLKGKTAQTTFLYNPQTVKLIEEYVVHYTDWEDSDIRVVSIAVFEKLADGKRFVMTNTHPAPHAEYYSGHMVELNRILTEELAKYEGLPVIMTGDFNTRESQPEYTTLMTTQNVRDARYDEGVELVRDVCTYTFLPSGEAVGGEIRQATNNSIDHIFINDKVQAKLFNIIIDHDVVHISDHLPIYADIILK